MGWRVSWYKADKDEPLKFRAPTELEPYVDVEINGTCVASNQGTEFWTNLKQDPNFQKEIVCLYEDPDCDYYSITKEGFKQIILAYRKRIIDYHRQALENHQNPDKKKEYGKYSGTPFELVQDELREWEGEWKDSCDKETQYFCIRLDDKNPNEISGSWKYKYAIFDMIFVYRTFDWENSTMVVYGG